MILENGVVRTMEPALPRAGALAIAGDRIAGGIGTHETALASPEVVELDGRGDPTGLLREESAWRFRARYVFGGTSEDEWVEAMRAGLRLAASRGVTAVHDKDGWLGALRFFQRLRNEEALTLRVWQSLPALES